MTTIARLLAARFSYRVAMPRHCLNRLTHLSATLRFRQIPRSKPSAMTGRLARLSRWSQRSGVMCRMLRPHGIEGNCNRGRR